MIIPVIMNKNNEKLIKKFKNYFLLFFVFLLLYVFFNGMNKAKIAVQLQKQHLQKIHYRNNLMGLQLDIFQI